MKYEINYSINKFEELFPNRNPTTTCVYEDNDGNLVEKENVTKELFRYEVTIDDDTFVDATPFGTFGFTETSLDNMTARQFIENVLIPHAKKMNSAIKLKYSSN